MAASICRNVLTFDPNDTIPPSIKAIDPSAADWPSPNRPSIAPSSKRDTTGDRNLGRQNELPASFGGLGKRLDPLLDF